MSAPMVLGSDVAAVTRWVLRELHALRPYRAPLFEALPDISPGELREVVVESVASRGLSERALARVALALAALENYYLAIGARWDARRMADMRWPVDELIRGHVREQEVDASNRHAAMWQRAFAEAWVDVSAARRRRAAAKSGGET